MNDFIVNSGYMDAFGRLNDQLKGTGIPFNGWSLRPPESGENPHLTINGQPFFVQLIHAEGTTSEQRRDLRQIVRDFVFEKRRPKNKADLRQALRALSDADFKDLLIELLVNELRNDSKFASRLGKMLDGDEADDSAKAK